MEVSKSLCSKRGKTGSCWWLLALLILPRLRLVPSSFALPLLLLNLSLLAVVLVRLTTGSPLQEVPCALPFPPPPPPPEAAAAAALKLIFWRSCGVAMDHKDARVTGKEIHEGQIISGLSLSLSPLLQ